MSLLLKCIFSPRLYRIYTTTEFHPHTPNILEQSGDFFISYLLPVGGVYSLWHRKLHYILYLTAFLLSSYAIRAAGRRLNPGYISFLKNLERVKGVSNLENLEVIRRYDFDFSSWPVGFTATKVCRLGREVQPQQWSSPTYILSYLVAHSFGIRLIYPGVLVGPMLRTYLEEARAKYVTELSGIRAKVVSSDGIYLDTMFFDRRRTPLKSLLSINEPNTESGKTLVICCEGNAGFYEIGMAGTPLSEGYSVLGWNHPGFGGSSGTPYPLNELNAAEAVFQYATEELGFKEEEIIIYGWSIGGYPAAYLASEHKNVKGLILDATFDDILPLALPRMPAFLGSIVTATIRNHVDLHISREIRNYPGPLRLIRRTEDEIIADPPSSLPGNRGNGLIFDVIVQRWPYLVDNEETVKGLKDWINCSHSKEPKSKGRMEEVHIPKDVEGLSNGEKNDLVIKIADKILTDYRSTHCTPLPGSYFEMPWIGSGAATRF